MHARLSLALASGAVSLPDLPAGGRVLLLRPPSDLDLSGLPDTIVAVHGFRPEVEALEARGLSVAAEIEGRFEAAVVFAARARALTLDLIARACAAVPPGAPVLVDGAKADGIDGTFRACRAAFETTEAFSKAHGKVFAFAAAPAPAGWLAEPGEADGFVTRAGVFSADGVDPGSALLASHLHDLKGRVCDLGAGWGFLASAVLASPGVTRCDLVEAEADALECARLNVTDPRAAFYWADATRWPIAGLTGGHDLVVSNPPFHTGRRADPDLGRAFVQAAARLAAPRGRLRMVANRHLPYEATLGAAFAEVVVLEDRGGYKVIEARRPKRTRGSAP